MPELCVISAILHHDHRDREQVFAALAAALIAVGTGIERLYYDLVFAELPEPERPDLQEVVMKTLTPEYRSEYNRAIFAEGESRGELRGEAKAILTVLMSRGFTLTDEARARINGCGDLDQLETWLRRVASITTLDELFA